MKASVALLVLLLGARPLSPRHATRTAAIPVGYVTTFEDIPDGIIEHGAMQLAAPVGVTAAIIGWADVIQPESAPRSWGEKSLALREPIRIVWFGAIGSLWLNATRIEPGENPMVQCSVTSGEETSYFEFPLMLGTPVTPQHSTQAVWLFGGYDFGDCRIDGSDGTMIDNLEIRS